VSASGDDAQLESLLEYLRDTRSLDFTGYKRASLERRIRKRVAAVGVAGLDEYRDHLELHPDEQTLLVETILINVTSFFRDEAAWTYLANELVPSIVAAKGADEPIRVWSAGCASGEEAFSLAMVFADHLGLEAFKSRVKIFATDSDDAALAEARRGTYTETQLEPVSAERRERYFEERPEGVVFRSDCRRRVIFGRNDITADAPISRLDLLVCRNVLMYFVIDTQRHVLNRFHYALTDGGYLFLGKAETIFSHSDLFDPVNTRLRIFRRVPGASQLESPAALTATAVPHVPRWLGVLIDLAAAATPVAQLVVDIEGRLVTANTKARAMFGITGDDLDRNVADLDVAHRPVELRDHIERAYSESQPVVLRDVTRTLAGGREQFLEVTIAPLRDPAGIDLGASVTFTDVTEIGHVRVELEQLARDLDDANRKLTVANEELEASNEELQSTNEELETTNEELQSSNEELETTNEELQSANQELETMNEEFLGQARQIEHAERFLASILSGLPVGVVVLDRQLDVVVWNRAAQDLFGLREDEVTQRSFLALDIGLPVGSIGPLLHAAIDSDREERQEVTLDAVNRRGQPFVCRVSVQRLVEATDSQPRLVVLLEPWPEHQP
jgi:two-component system CheB/CheR fusion protein